MRIGVDATCWNNRRGYGRHLRSLFNAVCRLDRSNEYVLFVDTPPDSLLRPLPPARLIEVPVSVPAAIAASADGRRSLADAWSMSRALSATDLECLIFPTLYSYVPVVTRAKKILMIHDVIAERLPQHVFPNQTGKMWWHLKSELARAQADRIVTVSDYSRQMLIAEFGLEANRVKVVGEAPDPLFRPLPDAALPSAVTGLGVTGLDVTGLDVTGQSAINQGLKRPDRLLTYVGGFGPHKNLSRLLDVFEKLAAQPRFEDLTLVLVGDYQTDPFYSGYGELKSRLAGSSVEQRVIFPGFLPDGDLVHLLNCSSLLVLPSLMEGYGLPAVEAAACGIPVVATEQSPLKQLLGDGVLVFDPYDADALQQSIESVLEDESLRRRMGQAALEAAGKLGWTQAAAELIAGIEEVAGEARLHYEPSA